MTTIDRNVFHLFLFYLGISPPSQSWFMGAEIISLKRSTVDGIIMISGFLFTFYKKYFLNNLNNGRKLHLWSFFNLNIPLSWAQKVGRKIIIVAKIYILTLQFV